MADKLNKAAWLKELPDVVEALYLGNANLERYNALIFAVFDDGSIFPMTNDCREAMNTDIAYYRKHPNEAIISDYCQSGALRLAVSRRTRAR